VIPVNEPLLDGNEAKYAAECIRTGWISSAGAFIEEFERAWADYCGMAHGVAVSNGTTALQVAVDCLDLEPGEEVILPTFTIISCAMAVVTHGGVPVVVDSDPRTWCMDVGQVEAKITPRTRAIMPVHIYGHPVDMDPLLELAENHGLAIVEDAAEVHGAEYKGRRCGGLGDISAFSFYANKIITTGEGGMVLTNDDALAEKARDARNLCFIPERRFLHKRLGYNYRLTNVQAAVGLAQVERIEALVERKRRMGAAYNERLGDIDVLQLPVEEPWAKNVYWMYGLVLDESTGMDAVAFARELAERGVQTRPFFLGMHEQPVFHDMGLFKGESYPVSERMARQGLYLPSGMALTMDQIDTVCEVVRDVLVA
jgi:perosamine synthetase